MVPQHGNGVPASEPDQAAPKLNPFFASETESEPESESDRLPDLPRQKPGRGCHRNREDDRLLFFTAAKCGTSPPDSGVKRQGVKTTAFMGAIADERLLA